MNKQVCLSRKSLFRTGIALTLLLALFPSPRLFPSDLSDAEMLRDRCDREFAEVQVPARNFGDKADLDRLNDGAQAIKLGKVKFLQSKYLEASDSFNKYLAIQQLLYKSLAEKYIDRTAVMADRAAMDLVESDKTKVVEYITLANQNLKDARAEAAAGRDKNAIKLCRVSKNYCISAYKAAGKAAPGEYRKDEVDNENRIAQ